MHSSSWSIPLDQQQQQAAAQFGSTLHPPTLDPDAAARQARVLTGSSVNIKCILGDGTWSLRCSATLDLGDALTWPAQCSKNHASFQPVSACPSQLASRNEKLRCGLRCLDVPSRPREGRGDRAAVCWTAWMRTCAAVSGGRAMRHWSSVRRRAHTRHLSPTERPSSIIADRIAARRVTRGRLITDRRPQLA